jgi:hypothetical protein
MSAGLRVGPRSLKGASAALMTGILLLCGAGQAQAVLLEVTSLDPDAPQGLETRITQANDTEAPDKIVFTGAAASGVIPLETNLPTIEEPLAIEGPGASALTLDGDGSDRILGVNLDAPGVRDGVSISGLTFLGGYAHGALTGGAIRNVDAQLTISQASFVENQSDAEGGAIESSAGSLIVSDSKFITNDSAATGGAIYGSGSITKIHRSIFDGNSLSGFAAVIGAELIEDSSFTGNHGTAVSIGTGAIVRRSTFSGNQGVGLRASSIGDPVRVESSTFTGNAGPGIVTQANFGLVELVDLTVVGNGDGGIEAFSGSATLANSVVAGNTGTDVRGGGGGPQPVATRYSLVPTSSPGMITNAVPGTNILGGGPPLVGQLSSNGGPTRTILLMAGSPALDKGLSTLGSDQRGLARVSDDPAIPNAPGGNGADIGATEIQVPPPAPPIKKKKCKKAKKRKKGKGKKAQASKKKKPKNKCKKKKKKKKRKA